MKMLIGLEIGKKPVTEKTKIEKWNGNFYCSGNELTSLEGAPREVDGNFGCINNNLVNLKGGPDVVKGNYRCGDNKLTSLEGAPRTIEQGYFSCADNKRGNLTSLVHAPEMIDGHFNCNGNKITSLKDIHKIIKVMDGNFMAEENPIESHVLGVLLIKGCIGIKLSNSPVEKILNKYLGAVREADKSRAHKDLIACQSELLDAGFDDYAQL